MQLYYFGTTDKPLFGVYHPAQGKIKRNEGIVLCPPLGTELLRSYRAFRLLSTRLTKAGYDVLRFDYYGTGDSSGECEAGSIKQWQEDIHTAIEELQDVSGVDHISLVGLRLGGTLAAGAAKKENIKRVVLWEPITDGKAYLNDRIETDLEYETEIGHEAELKRNLEEGKTIGIMGFEMSAFLQNELSNINGNWYSQINTERTFLLVGEETEQTLALQDILKQNSGKFGYEHIEHHGEWGEFDAIGSLLLPQATIQAIVACLL